MIMETVLDSAQSVGFIAVLLVGSIWVILKIATMFKDENDKTLDRVLNQNKEDKLESKTRENRLSCEAKVREDRQLAESKERNDELMKHHEATIDALEVITKTNEETVIATRQIAGSLCKLEDRVERFETGFNQVQKEIDQMNINSLKNRQGGRDDG